MTAREDLIGWLLALVGVLTIMGGILLAAAFLSWLFHISSHTAGMIVLGGCLLTLLWEVCRNKGKGE